MIFGFLILQAREDAFQQYAFKCTFLVNSIVYFPFLGKPLVCVIPGNSIGFLAVEKALCTIIPSDVFIGRCAVKCRSLFPLLQQSMSCKWVNVSACGWIMCYGLEGKCELSGRRTD